jgi:hypothetical protein
MDLSPCRAREVGIELRFVIYGNNMKPPSSSHMVASLFCVVPAVIVGLFLCVGWFGFLLILPMLVTGEVHVWSLRAEYPSDLVLGTWIPLDDQRVWRRSYREEWLYRLEFTDRTGVRL